METTIQTWMYWLFWALSAVVALFVGGFLELKKEVIFEAVKELSRLDSSRKSLVYSFQIGSKPTV
jgi:hypothetical protein